MGKVMCFTGRRPKDLCGYNWDNYKDFGYSLMDFLEQHLDEYDTFITGGAQGFDQIAFWAVYKLKNERGHNNIKNIVYVPFPGQENRWAEQGPFSKKEYNSIMHVADEVRYITTSTSDEYKYVAGFMLDRNKAMVTDSDAVVALYPDDSWETNKGGTSHCMRVANEAGKLIMQIKYEIRDNKLHFGSTKFIGCK